MSNTEPARLFDACASNPGDFPRPGSVTLSHECMESEHRCVYCGMRIQPVNCNGCGRFMDAASMHYEIFRCELCE